MASSFFEVFRELNLGDEAHSCLECASVNKVTVSTDRSIVHIYLESDRLIPKRFIAEAQRAVKKQLFPKDSAVKVKIVEKYRLSAQYNAKALMEMYQDSILYELKDYNIFLYQLFKNAGLNFTDTGSLTMTLEDSCISKEYAPQLEQILTKIFCERCGQDFKLTLRFDQPKKSKRKALNDKMIEEEVALISDNGKTAKEAPAAASVKEEPKTADSRGSAAQGKAGEKKNGGKEDGAKEKKAAGTFERKPVRRPLYAGNDPGMIYGKNFDDEPIHLDQVISEMGQITVNAQIISLEERQIRGEKSILIMDLTDFTDSITAKLFVPTESVPELKEKGLKQGAFVKIKGVTTIDRFDGQLSLGSVTGIRKTGDFREPRVDTWPEKRVELHCHTKMSDMDGVSDVKDIIGRAISFGQPALAVTDHGVVQAFPDAAHSVPKDSDFKVIYGMEGYLVDDDLELCTNPKGQKLDGSFVVFDIETTGFSPIDAKIIEIGAVKVENGKITDRFSTFVDPEVPIPYRIEQLTSINDQMVMGAPKIEEALPAFLDFCDGCVLVAHNAAFDMNFIRHNCAKLGLPDNFTCADTLMMARVLLTGLHRFKLDTVARAVGVEIGHHHRAVDDAECTAGIFVHFVRQLEEMDIHDVDEMNTLSQAGPDLIKKLPYYHVILLARNDVGRVNLYTLVSKSHLDYFGKRPRIPKSLLKQYREGLLIGSACEAGELYRAIVRGAGEEEISSLVSFYDFLEIQPLGNNMFMTMDDQEEPKTVDDLKEFNRRIVRLGEQYHKPVAATGDVHFLDPADSIYRSIIMAGKGFKDFDRQPPLYLRTTKEMLDEFAYLGEDKAREVVITNTNMIADMCEKISPVRPDKCPPVIENSDGMLRDICYSKAHEIYGDELPEVVAERLERELNSIISNGFAVMYIIAQKLVWKSNADGYLVGSRGSVGSSFVATMAGITEVNPLSPHYYCPSCHYSDFDSEEVRKFAGMAGCDMPDKVCPVCGEPLKKEGFDIPFETFLGFKGNKEPDIDLNFSGEYQSKAHKYTEVIFGAGQTFRAGTIGTLAEKTAFGYVKNYYKDKGEHKRNCEINRIVKGCTGVRRSTGQHPGGIIVLPYGEDINSFTPVQHPANDTETDIITTHFDYHSIDHNLLKLDILGHDDPTMIRMLEDLTGVNARQIPLDDKQVMSLFQNTDALGITPEQIGGCPLGSLGIPEFGTEFAIQMLVDTAPRYFSDLVRIAGLAHGTDVWLGNAQTLIQEGKATISTAICTRDDIMIYLIEKGLDKELSFTIMESVRKGKGLKPEWEQAMIEHDVPDWYIWSCKKIKYMFPKAHAAAYVMMAWRIAWFKINYPLAYYASFFSIRAPGFDYQLMCQGEDRLLMHMHDYEQRSNELSKKEEDEYKDMKVVREMYERGFEFTPIELDKVQATRFSIVDGKLMPSLSSIGGLGDKAAESVVDAVKDGPFLSREDFRSRTKVSKTMSDLLGELGILKDMPESNQLSLFDLLA